jgi:hypothetical protein
VPCAARSLSNKVAGHTYHRGAKEAALPKAATAAHAPPMNKLGRNKERVDLRRTLYYLKTLVRLRLSTRSRHTQSLLITIINVLALIRNENVASF